MERSDKQKEIYAFRLYNRVHAQNRYHTQYYNVTITPKGNNKLHETLLREVRESLKSFRVVESVFLIAEHDVTNHFHGVFVCKDKCKFYKLFNNKNPYHFHLKNMSLNDWCAYCIKHLPDKLYTSDTTEFFNKPFQTDITLAHYEP